MAAFGEQVKNDLYDALRAAKKDSGLSFAVFMVVVFEVLAWFASQFSDE